MRDINLLVSLAGLLTLALFHYFRRAPALVLVQHVFSLISDIFAREAFATGLLAAALVTLGQVNLVLHWLPFRHFNRSFNLSEVSIKVFIIKLRQVIVVKVFKLSQVVLTLAIFILGKLVVELLCELVSKVVNNFHVFAWDRHG